jgi:multiple sugar transport system permease protein
MFMVMDKTNLALSKVESAVYVFYNYTFTQGNKGYGAAIVMILVVFIMIVTVLMQRAEKRFVFYN